VKVLIVAPHPDDEVLGAGGTILRYKSEGHSVAWLLVTNISGEFGWNSEQIKKRDKELIEIQKFFSFDEVFKLDFPTTKLDTLPMGEIVQSISNIIEGYGPDEVFIPHRGDVHTDHQIVHKAVLSCTKWFRYPFIKRIFSYETLSETAFGKDNNSQFSPNVFVDISYFIDLKVKAMEIYSSEIGEFPFPRSRISIEALARYRGSSSGFQCAESFQLLMERR
jgi:N-acetylglucosamine malate deacetylase 1